VKNQQSKRYYKKPEFGSSKFTCFGCGKHDHIKVDCPSMTNKDKGQEKKSNRVGKTRRAYIAWEDNDTSWSNSLQEEIEVNLYLMAGEKSEVNSVNSSASFNSENYNSLLQALFETHEEANRLSLSNNWLKGLNNWLEGRVKELEYELLTLKTNFDNLEMVYKSTSSNDFDFRKTANCEDCVVLKNKVNYLIKATSRLSMRTVNLNAILGSQNYVFEKAGFQRKQKKFNSFFRHNKNQSSPFITCFYCMKKGHSVRNYIVKNFDVLKGLVRWV